MFQVLGETLSEVSYFGCNHTLKIQGMIIVLVVLVFVVFPDLPGEDLEHLKNAVQIFPGKIWDTTKLRSRSSRGRSEK